DIQKAFHDACVHLDYRIIEDTNGANPAGIGVWPSNNLDGWRMSAAITHLHPMRHRLNLTVRGNVFVRRVLFVEKKAVGVEVESGGELCTVEAARVVLSAGALKSPHILMLSRIAQKAPLAQFGIPLVHELPGVGENLWNHLAAQITFKVKDGKSLVTGIDTARYSLHYTSSGSDEVNDMLLRTTPVVDERPERVPGVRTQPLTGDARAHRVARISCTLGLPDGAGYVRLASADPTVQPTFNYRYLHHPNDKRRVREGIRIAIALLQSEADKDGADYRIRPREDARGE